MARAAVLSGLIDATVDRLRAQTAFTMARLAEYGKVGGYAPEYLALRREVAALCRALAAVTPDFDDRPLRRLPEPALRRALMEDFFLDERATLIGVLADARAALRAVDPDVIEDNWARLDPGLAAAVDRLIKRSGVGVALPPPDPPRSAPSLSDPPRSDPPRSDPPRSDPPRSDPPRSDPLPFDPQRPAAARMADPGRAGAAIYVSSRFAPELGEQIAAYLSMRGLQPVSPARRAAVDRGRVDLSRAEAALRGCAGGFFSLVLPGEANGRAAGPSLGDALTMCLPEVSVAQRLLGRRIVIIAQRDMVPALPDQLRAHPIFALRSSVMNDEEFSTFVSMASRTSWLRA